jgi:hypothetical protein
MNADEFFLETLEDLREKVSKRPPREYDFALIGLLLRKLLMDGDRLLDKVNLKREKVRYQIPVLARVVRCRPVRKGGEANQAKTYNWSAQGILGLFDFLCSSGRSTEFMTWMEKMSPEEAKSVDICDLKLESFLKVTVDIHSGEASSVKDLIDYAAHVFGGAHFSAPRNEQQKRLVRSQELLSAPYPLQLGMLQPIGWIVIRGLHSIGADVRTRVLP